MIYEEAVLLKKSTDEVNTMIDFIDKWISELDLVDNALAIGAAKEADNAG